MISITRFLTLPRRTRIINQTQGMRSCVGPGPARQAIDRAGPRVPDHQECVQPGASPTLRPATALRERIGTHESLADRAIYEPVVAAPQTALGEQAFDAARSEGQAMTQEDAITCALESSDIAA
jgi:hypothetical protein